MVSGAAAPAPDVNSRTFDCIYCGRQLEARAEQVDCVIECAGCRRSVIVPADLAASLWDRPVPLEPYSRLRPAIAALVTGLMGSLACGIIAFTAFFIMSQSIIGIGVRDTILASVVGAGVGGLVGALLGWNLSTR